MSVHRIIRVVLVCCVVSSVLEAQETRAGNASIPNDQPDFFTSAVPFIGVTPCRIVDTRDQFQPPGYGPPSLAAGQPRNFTVAGRCEIPYAAQAVSLNITAVGPLGLGYILLYPQGATQPVVSTLNYVTGLTVANAAIVPLGADGLGGITVAAAVSGTDLLIDVNGYYGATTFWANNTFVGNGAGGTASEGDLNTAIGSAALNKNVSGAGNTASGQTALNLNIAGNYNTADGTAALLNNTAGSYNTASGAAALLGNVGGSENTAVGTTALLGNVIGNQNTAIGRFTLQGVDGNRNIAVGYGAGQNLTSGDNNMYLGNEGIATESNTIRIGSGDFHNRAFVAGVRDVTTGSAGALPVLIDPLGQLGTLNSSARFKDEIRDMEDASSGLLRLRPVTFRYKGQAGERRSTA